MSKVKSVPDAGSYDDLLDRSWDEIPEPRTLPNGPWLLECRNIAHKKATETSNAKVLFFFTPKEPMEGVDTSQLEDLGDYDVSDNQVVHTAWVEFNRDWQGVRDLLTKMGVETKGRSQKDSFKAAKGAQIVGVLDERTYETAAGEMKTENIVKSFIVLE